MPGQQTGTFSDMHVSSAGRAELAMSCGRLERQQTVMLTVMFFRASKQKNPSTRLCMQRAHEEHRLCIILSAQVFSIERTYCTYAPASRVCLSDPERVVRPGIADDLQPIAIVQQKCLRLRQQWQHIGSESWRMARAP